MFRNTQTRDMTVGNPIKLIISFAIPLYLGNMLQQLYNVVDTAIVGRGVGTEALAAVGSTGSITWMIMGFIFGFTHGFSIAVSQSFGRGDDNTTRRTVYISIFLSFLLSLVVSVVGCVFAEDILRLMDTPEDIIADATLYITIIFAGSVFQIIYNIFASVLRAFGNSTVPLLVVVIAAGFNIVADFLFVMVFKWGVAGAAIATVMANVICVPVCGYFLFKIPLMKYKKGDLRWDKDIAARLMKLGLPVGIMNSVTAFGMVLVQSVVNSMGSLIVASYSVARKIMGALDQAISVLGMSLSTFVGQNVGSGKFERAKKGVRSTMAVSMGCCVVIFLILFLFGKFLISLFIDPSEVEVVNNAYLYLVVCGIMMWALGLLFLYRFSLQALGDTVVPMFSGLLELVSRPAVVFLLPESLGFLRMSLAESITWVCAAILLAVGHYYCLAKIEKNPDLILRRKQS